MTSSGKRATRSKRPHARRGLERYAALRDFETTSEPDGRSPQPKGGRSFVVQKHAARHLHYDLRLEHEGVLLSWAVPKGPSLNPRDKRLAVQVEAHPIDYRDFEGTIPAGQYGAGAVIVWDRGSWAPLSDPDEGLKKGHLDFALLGEKLRGRFHLVRTRGGDKPTWLLMKQRDAWSDDDPQKSVVDAEPASVLSGRTVEEVREGSPDARGGTGSTSGRAASLARKAGGRTSVLRDARSSAGFTPGPMPTFGTIEPELATLVKDVPSSGPWIYELKYDGYRAMSWLEAGKVRIASRRGLDWTKRYGTIAAALSRVQVQNAIFDGEIAFVREDGGTDFQKLQDALAAPSPSKDARLVYFVFDLLYLDGIDLRGAPLSLRRDKLRTVLANEALPLRVSGDVADGRAFAREVCRMGLEGVIGKRTDLPYRPGRSTDWIKVKCDRRQELIVVGFTPQKDTGKGIGALLLGYYEGSDLRYAGKVGSGFSHATLKDISRRLKALVVTTPTVKPSPPLRNVSWVKPELVAQVRFSDFTEDGLLRQSSFEGLRLDKLARDVHLEIERSPPTLPSSPPSPSLRAAETSRTSPRVAPPVKRNVGKNSSAPEVDGVAISNADRVMDPNSGHTKLDLARYARDVADEMLPFIAKRPLMLQRCPMGIGPPPAGRIRRKTSCFMQKHPGRGLERAEVEHARTTDDESIFVTNHRQLVLLAQHDTIELHGWGSRFPRWDRPDWIVLDLDPDEQLPFSHVTDSALEIRAALRTLRLECWVKTTGGKGLHVVVPIARRYDWPTVEAVARRIATLMAEAAPERYVATMSKRARKGKIFIDYLRNAEGATAVLPYSARGRPHLPVAMPIAWNDLRSIDPPEFTIATVPKLLARRRGDPWKDLLATPQRLPRELIEACHAFSATQLR